jgi:hypothetical protein
MYIIKPSSHTERDGSSEVHLLISAHGMVMPGSFRIPGNLDVHFYGRHGAAVYDPGAYDIIKGVYQVLETSHGADTCSNYLLTKYQTSSGDETYGSLQSGLDRNSGVLEDMRAGKTRDRNYAYDFDVLTIRNRKKMGAMQFSTVLNTLVQGGHRYDQIHCSFCRWRPFGGSVSAPAFGS